MNIDQLRETYKGDGIKIAILDTGIDSSAMPVNSRIYHYISNNCNVIENDEVSFSGAMIHGSLCCLKLLEAAPNAEIYDINILDNDNNIVESNVIKAIEFCIERNIDIINISLGFEKSSNLFLNVCNKAIENDIIIIAAERKKNKDKITFPADFQGVVKVTTSAAQDSKYEVLSDNYISMSEDIFKYNGLATGELSSINPKSTSVACAYFSGLVSLLIQSRPFMTKQSVIKQITSIQKPTNIKDILDNEETDGCQDKASDFSEKTVVAVIDSALNDLSDYKNIINKNIIGFYNAENRTFLDFNNNVLGKDDFNEIVVINSSISNRRKIVFNDYIEEQKVKFIQNNTKRFNKLTKVNKIYSIDSPIIAIGSFGSNNSKFYIQAQLYKQLQDLGVEQTGITYNPLGSIFDFVIYDYSDKIIFPDIIYSINNNIKVIEKNNANNQLFLINIGSGLCSLTEHDTNNFGILFQAFLKALVIDVLILSINPSLSVDAIKNELIKLKLAGVPNVILVVSEYSYTFSETKLGALSSYQVSNSLYNQFLNSVKKQLSGYPVFSLDDVNNGKVVNYIISQLS